MGNLNKLIGTIAGSATTSSAFPLDGALLLEVCLDSGFDGTSLTPQTSDDGVTYQTVQKNGADLTWTVAASKNINVAADQIIANYVRYVAGSQTGATTIISRSLQL